MSQLSVFPPIDIIVDMQGTVHSRRVPLRLSVPFAKGVVTDVNHVGIEVSGERQLCQTRTLQRWPDNSVRWCLIDWLHPTNQNHLVGDAQVVYTETACSSPTDQPRFELTSSDTPPTLCHLAVDVAPSLPIRLRAVSAEGKEYLGTARAFTCSANGAIRQQMVAEVTLKNQDGAQLPLQIRLAVDAFASCQTAVLQVTVTNPQPATHPNGNWDLGNGGSIHLQDLSVEFQLPAEHASQRIRAWTAPSEAAGHAHKTFQLFQASSGGEHWQASNHLNQDHKVELSFRGFQIDCDDATRRGLRATPQIVVERDTATLAIAMRRYWENFPKSISVSGDLARLSLFPRESGYLHELQGGEQKTHEFAIYYGNTPLDRPLAWYLELSAPRLHPDHYAAAEAIPFLTPRQQDPNTRHHALVDSAIEGDDSFFAKREIIDEYGWRHFGDIYGDHEAAFHDGTTPLVSHYNNQYDCTGGFATQFFRTGDPRWFEQMVAMADHAWDIDTYHTSSDKNLYNQGLFWHTYHYADADTGTHRSYPRSLNDVGDMPGGKDLDELGATGKSLKKVYGLGGGPSASHNYNTGWMYAYYLTGETQYRDAAINAADYVMRIEDGSKTIFRFLSRADTGYSIESSAGYHGPGRAAANSLQALLTGFELTGDANYLRFSEQLIRRVIHPQDSIEKLDLLNAELRWFYTMFLQALMRFIDLKAACQQNDQMYAYAVAALNHYAGWMLQHERPTLDTPERLQYPTETWIAQDMRKWHILQYAAWLNQAEEPHRKALQAKADSLYNYVCDTLSAAPTRTLCRPVVLMTQFGWQRNWFQTRSADIALPQPEFEGSLPAPSTFVPQRAIAVRRAKYCILGAATLMLAALLSILYWLLQGVFQ
ncbi:MAG: hypothetical protein CL681_10240 [Blastopirellula sp.]|nr:hypothetical protein [Blastopirellula sp.]